MKQARIVPIKVTNGIVSSACLNVSHVIVPPECKEHPLSIKYPTIG